MKKIKKVIKEVIKEKVEPANPESVVKSKMVGEHKITGIVGDPTANMVEVVLDNGSTTMVPRELL